MVNDEINRIEELSKIAYFTKQQQRLLQDFNNNYSKLLDDPAEKKCHYIQKKSYYLGL